MWANNNWPLVSFSGGLVGPFSCYFCLHLNVLTVVPVKEKESFLEKKSAFSKKLPFNQTPTTWKLGLPQLAVGDSFSLRHNFECHVWLKLFEYESFATVGEIRVYRRADFQSGSRVLKKVF